MQSGYVLLVRDDAGRIYFVGRRDALSTTLEDVAIYTRDPISPGHFFAVHHDERARVTWSDDWGAVVEAGIAGEIGRTFYPGHGDPYAQHETYTLPAHLLTLEGARAAA